MNLFLSIAMLGGISWIACVYWGELGQSDPLFDFRSLLAWIGLGILVPAAGWLLLNVGISSMLPPLLPEVALAQNSGQIWWPMVLRSTGPALFLIGSGWGAVTFSWLVVGILGRIPAEQRREFRWITVFWLALLSPLTGGLVYVTGGWGTALAITIGLLPVVHYTLPLTKTHTLAPSYSRAVAKIQFGKFSEAEWEVIKELENCEDDFNGWMMLAEIYAVHYCDLAAASETVHDLASQDNVNASQLAVAFNRLADWHLRIGADPVAARAALEVICQKMPGTHMERMARQRIQHLPASREELVRQRQGRTIRLPAQKDPFAQSEPDRPPKVSRANATALVSQYLASLKENPNDVACRERLAWIFAVNLRQFDLAIQQMEFLLALPGHPAPKIVEWLSLCASWHLHQENREAAKAIFQRLVREYPQCPEAFAAQRQLSLLERIPKQSRIRPKTSSY